MSSTTSIKKVQTSSSLTSALIKLIWGTLILVGEQRGLVIFMTRLMSWKRSCFSQRRKKKNFSNKNTSLHEKKNEFAFLRTFTKHRRTNGVVYYRHNLAKCLSLKKKINYNRLQKLRNVILKTLFKVEPPLLYVYCHFFIYIQFQLLNVYKRLCRDARYETKTYAFWRKKSAWIGKNLFAHSIATFA